MNEISLFNTEEDNNLDYAVDFRTVEIIVHIYGRKTCKTEADYLKIIKLLT